MTRRVKKANAEKISKGYRLSPATHELIYRIQYLLNSDLDTAISRACQRYYRQLVRKNSINKN